MPPGGSRRFHTKSRNGCQECKRRRVKCDCATPTCGHCGRRNQECVYPSFLAPPDKKKSTSNHSMSPSGGSSSSSTSPTAASAPAVGSYNAGDTFAAQQVAYFSERTCYTLPLASTDEECMEYELRVWESFVPQMTAQYEFLRHTIVSITALHRCFDGLPGEHQRDYYTAACAHSVDASRLFRETLNDVNEHTWLPACAFFLAGVIFELNVPLVAEWLDPNQPLDPLYGFLALRNAWALGARIEAFCPISSVAGQDAATAEAGLDPGLADTLAALEATNYSAAQPAAERQTCANAVALLRDWAGRIPGSLQDWLLVLWWPAHVSRSFVDLLRLRKPMALTIFINWCYIMRYAPERWYLINWIDRADECARSYLA